jgi:hypothetical protein
MQDLLLGTWGCEHPGYNQQHPWRVFAAVIVAILLLDFLFRKGPSSIGAGGDFSGPDCDGGGDGCGGD